jgi:hypothetical protein
MNLLGAILYDPAVAVTRATSALLAMTALDTTNLRLTVTVPAHGMLRIRIRCIVHGATTFPTILLGCLEGSTVRGRVSPLGGLKTTAVATAQVTQEADYILTGLTPGSITLDAAYAVEVVVAATGIKYGGPNNATTNDAFGGIQFEIYDPQPVPTAIPGGSGGLFIAGTNAATTVNFTGSLSGSVGSVAGNVSGNVVGSVASVTAAITLPTIPADWITAAGIAAAALNGKGDWLLSSGYTAPLDAAGTRSAVGLAAANLDTQLAALPTAAEITTDVLAGASSTPIAADVKKINSVTVTGVGTIVDPWGP